MILLSGLKECVRQPETTGVVLLATQQALGMQAISCELYWFTGQTSGRVLTCGLPQSVWFHVCAVAFEPWVAQLPYTDMLRPKLHSNEHLQIYLTLYHSL